MSLHLCDWCCHELPDEGPADMAHLYHGFVAFCSEKCQAAWRNANGRSPSLAPAGASEEGDNASDS